MKKIVSVALTLYCFFLMGCLLAYGLLHIQSSANVVQSALMFPVALLLYRDLFGRFPLQKRKGQEKSFIYRLLYIYSIVLTSILFLALAYNARNFLELIFVGIFSPVFLYFFGRFVTWLALRPRNDLRISIDEGEIVRILPASDEEQKDTHNERRKFFRIITSAGIGGLLLYLMFPRRADAAFFGSMPGPGTISIKDSTGTTIDPATSSPTDGYAISNVDNTAYPYYYGFVNKDAAWYIMRENPENTYTYTKGTSSYATNWTGRAGLTYGTFDTIF